MNGLQISLFGKFQAQYDDRRLSGLEPHKVQELFCYLLLHRHQSQSRESLADLLWANTSTAQSKKHLRQLLWQLQCVFESQIKSDNGSILLAEPDWIQLNPRFTFWLDVAVFEGAFELTRGVAGRELDGVNVCALQQATELYRGDLLEGWYQEWCLYERERLQNKYLAMLEKLMEYYETHCQYEAGQAYGICLLRYDPAHERIHRRLMRLYYLSGDRTAALRQYDRCVEALATELGVKPSKYTVALLQQIQADQLETLLPHPVESIPKPVRPPTSLTEVLTHLRQVQADLINLEHQVVQDIQVIEHLLLDHPSEPPPNVSTEHPSLIQ